MSNSLLLHLFSLLKSAQENLEQNKISTASFEMGRAYYILSNEILKTDADNGKRQKATEET